MDLGNSPATIESARLCDFYGCLKGHQVSVADAYQAYIQAELGGDACWIALPREAYPQSVKQEIDTQPQPTGLQHCSVFVQALEVGVSIFDMEPIGPGLEEGQALNPGLLSL